MKEFFAILFLSVVGVFCGSCIVFSGNISLDDVWKVPDTNLKIIVSASNKGKGETDRKMTLSENYSREKEIALARGSKNFARLNVYQTSENQYLLKDVYKTYLLDTSQKTLQETDASALNAAKKFIGAFDYNENGSWRYIPESERKEIPLAGAIEN